MNSKTRQWDSSTQKSKGKKRVKNRENSWMDLWDTTKWTNICITGGPRKRREKGKESLFKERMAENFPHLKKETDIGCVWSLSQRGELLSVGRSRMIRSQILRQQVEKYVVKPLPGRNWAQTETDPKKPIYIITELWKGQGETLKSSKRKATC